MVNMTSVKMCLRESDKYVIYAFTFETGGVFCFNFTIRNCTKKISETRSHTMDKDINCCCCLAVFNFQVFIITPILSSFIHGCICDG